MTLRPVLRDVLRPPLRSVFGAELSLSQQLGQLIQGQANTYLFDARDLTSIKQDLNGTPGAVGQPVGFMANKRNCGTKTFAQYVTDQPELVDNASEAADWTAYGTNTVEDDDGAVKVTYVDNASGAYIYLRDSGALTENLTVGNFYEVAARIKVGSGDSLSMQVYNGSAYTVTGAVTSTDYMSVSVIIEAQGATTAFIAFTSMGAGEELWVKDVSVKDLGTGHRSQANAAPKPALQSDYSLLYDGSDDDLPFDFDGGAGSSTASHIVARKTNTNTQIHGTRVADTAPWFGWFQSGNAGPIASGVGTPTYEVDGASIGTTAGDLYTAVADNTWHDIRHKTMNMSTWAGVRPYPAYEIHDLVSGRELYCTDAFMDANIDLIRAWVMEGLT